MILVTGADGFIGSHVVEELVRAGRDVRALALYNSFGSHGWLDELASDVRDGVDLVLGDVRDPACVRDALEGCEAVVHLAALIAIPYSYRAPSSYVDTNVCGTLNVLEAARQCGDVHVIQTSTSEVYGSAQQVPIREDHPLSAQSPYAASKIAADQLALSFHRSFGIPVTVVRPFNTYGPRQSLRAVIPSVITQLLAGERRLRLGALHPTRDFSFVSDTARGLVAPLGRDAALGQVIQLGTGTEVSIGEVVGCIAERLGVEVEVEEDAARMRPEASEVERLVSDPARAHRLLEWKPEYTGLDGLARGLDRTIAWFRDAGSVRAPRSFRV